MNSAASDLYRRAWRRQALFVLFLAGVLFAPAGTLDFWQGWLFGLVFVASTLATGIYFAKHDPALVARRRSVGPKAETEPAQKIIMTILMTGFLLLGVVPGLDHRWHWSDVPVWLVLAADGGVVLSFAVFFVVMRENSYAAATIRVEAGQPVISTGIYAIVRHPMYAGALLLVISTPVALGSYWALLVVVAIFPALVWRLVDEERFLLRNLPGYDAYCRQTRYRIVPGVW
jgi:protein-S-isoprenylcysteine O-methyltransferase Ste14